MKTILTTLLGIFISLNLISQSKCPDCHAAMIKDQFNSKESFDEKLHSLSIINKEDYEVYKRKSSQKSGGGLEIFDVLGFSASSTSSYEDFNEKRTAFFQKNEFHQEITSAKEISIVNNKAIAYTTFSDCIKLCYTNDPNLTAIYGYVEYEDSMQFNIKIKYQANGLGKDSVNAHISVDNGLVIYDGETDSGDWSYMFYKNEEIGLIVKRKDRLKVSTLTVRAEGGNVFQYSTVFQRRKKQINLNCKVTFSKTKTTYVKDRTNSSTTRSPDLHGKSGAAKNVIVLPNLTNGERYRNFSNILCSVDNEGACKWNYGSGYCIPAITVNGDSSMAKVEFSTASRSCEWGWKADVYKPDTKILNEEKNIKITTRTFKVKVPINFVNGHCEFILNDDLVYFSLGSTDSDQKVKFISQDTEGEFRYFIYKINE